MSVQRRVFPGTLKQAVDRVANSGLSIGAVARELGLPETVLRRWMTQFGVQATRASRRPTQRRRRPRRVGSGCRGARLRRENGQLRMEREPQVGA